MADYVSLPSEVRGLMDQTLILVDPGDRWLGYAQRSVCHEGDGKLHRAIAAILFDAEGHILLQKRKASLWDGYWDVTGATHPLHLESHDESYEEAAERCIVTEWGIQTPLRRELSFTYFARFAEYCENEYCVVLTGQYDGTPAYNHEHAYDLRWVDPATCLQEMQREPQRFTPWAHHTMRGVASTRPGLDQSASREW